jgi:hypothetical protein
MVRLLLILLTVLAVMALAPQAVLGQGPTPVPTPRADEIGIVGRIPAPPGTTVTIGFIDPEALQIVQCGTSVSAPFDGEPDMSGFALVIAVDCVIIGFPASICWSQDLCDGFEIDPGAGGQTVDVGLLSAPSSAPPTPLPPVEGDFGPQPGGPSDAALPAVGVPDQPGQGAPALELIWLATGLLVGGLALAIFLRWKVGRPS